MTQFVCQEVAIELTKSASRAVRADTWDTLRWDVEVYD